MNTVGNTRQVTGFPAAKRAYQEGKVGLAERLCRSLLAADPGAADACHMLGVIRTRQGRLAEARDLLERAARLRPDKPTWARNLATVCLRQNCPLDAIGHLESALPGGPAELHGALNHARLTAVPQWHFPMLNDRRRADAYRGALRQTVGPDSIVLDIGAGSGLLSLMAVDAGAKHVYAVESAPALAENARRTIRADPRSERVTLFEMEAAQLQIGVHLPRPPDVVVTEIFDASLLSEGALGTLRLAHERLIGARTQVIPRKAVVLAKLVESDELRQEVSVAGPLGHAMNRFSPMYLERNLHWYHHHTLTPEIELAHFDFYNRSSLMPGEQRSPVTIRESGQCDAIAMRFRLELADGVAYESGTEANHTHWAHWVRFLEPPLQVRRAQRLDLRALYDDSFLALDALPE